MNYFLWYNRHHHLIKDFILYWSKSVQNSPGIVRGSRSGGSVSDFSGFPARGFGREKKIKPVEFWIFAGKYVDTSYNSGKTKNQMRILTDKFIPECLYTRGRIWRSRAMPEGERLLVYWKIYQRAAGPAQGTAGRPAGVPLMLYRCGESGAGDFGFFTGHRGCFPVQPRDGGCGEVFGL